MRVWAGLRWPGGEDYAETDLFPKRRGRGVFLGFGNALHQLNDEVRRPKPRP